MILSEKFEVICFFIYSKNENVYLFMNERRIIFFFVLSILVIRYIDNKVSGIAYHCCFVFIILQ